MQNHPSHLKPVLLLIGAILSAAIYCVTRLNLTSNWQEGAEYFFAIAGFLLCFAIPNLRTIKLISSSFIISACFAASIIYIDSSDINGIISYLMLLWSIYIVYCFHQVYYEQERFSFPYTALFLTAWNSIFILLISLFFTGLCWIIISICTYLFKGIGFSFLYDIFFSRSVEYILTGALLGLSIAIGRENENLIAALRRILFALCYFLLPVLAIFGVLYLIALIIGKQQASFDYSLYVSLSLLAIFLLNGVYQTGDQSAPYSRFVRWYVNIFFFLFPIYPLLILQRIRLDINMVGIRPETFSCMILACILFLYSIGYFIALFNRKSWFGFLNTANTYLAVLFVLITFALNSPVLNAYNISAKNQTARLLANQPLTCSSNKTTMSCFSSPYLANTQLANKNLSHRDLSRANLRNANLAGSDLSYSKLTSANLTNANLSGANLTGADLSYANVGYTNFSNANLTNVIATNVYNCPTNLQNAIIKNVVKNNTVTDTFVPNCYAEQAWKRNHEQTPAKTIRK